MAEDIKYNDQKNGTYVHPTANIDEPSPVSNPNGNINLDESHRDMLDEDFRPSFSNLDNTFMFSSNGHKARERFWGAQYSHDFSYRNSNADIEDPIFTGFTLSIDKLNSPLFYTIGEYDGIASGRTKTDDRSSVRNIADEIENCLRNNYSALIRSSVNSYDISAILTKEKFPNNSEIGYGMQHNVYVDGLPYGATEYIYMVDKQVKDFGSSQDKGGHFSLGDGSETKSISDYISKEDLQENASLLSGQMVELQEYLDNEENKAAHRQIENEKKDAENELKRVQDEMSKIRRQIKALENQSTSANKETFETAVRNKLKELLNRMDNAVINLKPTGNRSSHSLEQYNNIVNTISSLDSMLQTTISQYDRNSENVQSIVSSVDSSVVKVTSCTITTEEPSDYSSYTALPIDNSRSTFDGSEAYKKGGKYRKIKITVTVDVNESDTLAKLSDYKKQLENLESKERELIQKVKETTAKYENDQYSQREKDLENVKNDLIDVNESISVIEDDMEIKYNGSRRASEDARLHTGDVSSGVEDDQTSQNSNKTTIPDAPQTVYDMLGFIRGMTRLTTEYPYLMQTITGLDEAYKNNYGVKDSFRGSIDNKISITIYESLDLKVSGMFNKYFNAVYDAQYRRERVPVNLRRFNCSVFVHDIRNFYKMTTSLGRAIRKSGQLNIPKIVEVALNSMSAIEFKFFGCEIIPEETGSIFENVSNADRGDMRMTNFTFSYSDCVVNYLPFEDMKHNLLRNLSKGPHRPSVSISNRNAKKLDELKYPLGTKTYTMTSEKFDERKPKLNGLLNVNDNNRKSKVKENNIEFTGDLEGLDGHSTIPQQKSEHPETLFNKMNYMLNSPLGNVNLNDPAKERSSTQIDEPQLNGINSTVQDYMVSSIGNVNENDNLEKSIEDNREVPNMVGIISRTKGNKYSSLGNVNINDPLENTPKDDGSQNYEVVKHGYFDNSPLGNVNNDDYEEYRRLRLNRDRGIEMKDRYMEGIATHGAIESVNENLTESRKEFERLFKYLATSVAASVGQDRGNVYSAYLEEIEHIVFPGNNTSTVGAIDYNSSPDTNNTTINLGVPQLNGVTSVIANGYVRRIGNVNDNDNLEPVPMEHGSGVVVNGVNTTMSNGIVTGLGDVLPDDNPSYIINTIDDVLPDDVNGPDVTQLGNVYPPNGRTTIQGYIDDVLPDDPQVPPIGNIGNVYPPNTTPPIEGYIGDVLPDDPQVPNVTQIGNVYPTLTTPRRQRYIDDVLPDDPQVPNTTNIGNIYPNQQSGVNVSNLGDVLPDDPQVPNITNIGNIYPTVGNSRNISNLGDVLPNDQNRPIVEDIDNIYPQQDTPLVQRHIGDVTPDETTRPNVSQLGNIYPTDSRRRTQEYIGDVIQDDPNRPIVEEIENIYPNQGTQENVRNLGKLDTSEKIGNVLKKLDKLSEKKRVTKDVNDLGKV